MKYGLIKAAKFTIGKSQVEKNGIEMYSTHNEGKSVITERFIRTFNNKV